MQVFGVLFPGVAYILLTLVFSKRAGTRESAEAFIKAHIVLFTFILVSTEILSLFDAIIFPGILTSWLFFLILCCIVLFKQSKGMSFYLSSFRQIHALKKPLVMPTVFILGGAFASAVLYPPNNWDSMTYHMSRVVNWISNNNINFYPTEIARQNYQMPLAEFGIMHLQVLTGSDLYANLVQWMSFVVLLCLGVIVAVELGLNSRQQLISVICIATLPMGILQASSTQNDLVVSVFIMSFSLFMLRLQRNLTTADSAFAALSLGLALITKATAFIYCAGIGIPFGIALLIRNKHNHKNCLKAASFLVLILITGLLINTGHFFRNYKLYGNPISTEGDRYFNESMTISKFSANVIRNGAIHLGVPVPAINRHQEKLIGFLLGSKLNDPAITWGDSVFKIPFNLHEDHQGNLIHALLVFFGVIPLIIALRKRFDRNTLCYALGIIAGACFFCFALKWQPWGSRLHTPFFILSAPMISIILTSGIGFFKPKVTSFIIVSMLIYSLPFTLSNLSRSLVSLEWLRNERSQLYFQNRKYLYSDYNEAINSLKKVNTSEAGLLLGADDFEFPIWVLAGKTWNDGTPVSFSHLGVSNISRKIRDDIFQPEYIVSTKPIRNLPDSMRYANFYNSEHINVFRRLKNK